MSGEVLYSGDSHAAHIVYCSGYPDTIQRGFQTVISI